MTVFSDDQGELSFDYAEWNDLAERDVYGFDDSYLAVPYIPLKGDPYPPVEYLRLLEDELTDDDLSGVIINVTPRNTPLLNFAAQSVAADAAMARVAQNYQRNEATVHQSYIDAAAAAQNMSPYTYYNQAAATSLDRMGNNLWNAQQAASSYTGGTLSGGEHTPIPPQSIDPSPPQTSRRLTQFRQRLGELTSAFYGL